VLWLSAEEELRLFPKGGLDRVWWMWKTLLTPDIGK
jgi:hypothetical protein